MKWNQKEGRQVAKHVQPKKSFEFAGTAFFENRYYRNSKRDIQRSYQDKPVISPKRSDEETKVYPAHVVSYNQNDC